MTNSRVIAVNDISRVTVNLDAMINVFTRTPRCVYIASCVINHRSTCNKLHRESKNKTLNSARNFPKWLWTDFQNSFADRLTGKFAINLYLNIPPHLKYVACEIWMSENWRQSTRCIVINDKSQCSTVKHLSCDGLLHYKFIIQFAGERIFKIGEHLAKL